ncbi:MAG: acetate--CoA ligase family protein [Acidimicrobiia bacterium]
MTIVERRLLSEHASKQLLAEVGVPVVPEYLVDTPAEAAQAAAGLGFPVVAKLCADGLAHKTERGLVRLGLPDAEAVTAASADLLASATSEDGPAQVLVAPMVPFTRELIVGAVRDDLLGPAVLLGVGGILAEVAAASVVRPAPLSTTGALAMIDDVDQDALLGAFRGEEPVDRGELTEVLVHISELFDTVPGLVSVDVNPLAVTTGGLVALDALVEVEATSPDGADPDASTAGPPARSRTSDVADVRERFSPLFEPRGVVVAGASSHPGKFGFVALHNILTHDYEGEVLALNARGGTVLGLDALRDPAEIPDGSVDLVVACTPPAANAELLRACAVRGARAAFVASGGYSEAGDDGTELEAELAAVAADTGMLIAGPNGQGLVSTPVGLCAQIVAPYPPRGHVAVASQSGNFVSAFGNLARHSGVGISRAVSAGNASMVGITDYLDYFTADPETSVSLLYLEGVADGPSFTEHLRTAASEKPVVVLKGGATEGGRRAAASHTGSLAGDDAIFDGICRAAGATRVHSVQEGFDAAATFATQPLPAGPRTVVLTTAGGWGVAAADAITRSRLDLVALPERLVAALDEKLPPRWSRNNPVDLAGGETRDTIPEVLDLLVDDPDVDAVVLLGVGIQSNQAAAMRSGRFWPGEGLERIVEYHERQDVRFVNATVEAAARSGKPVLAATELAVAAPDNTAVVAARDVGAYLHHSAERAVRALEHLHRYAADRARR